MTSPFLGGPVAARAATVQMIDRTLVAQAAGEWMRMPVNNLQAAFVEQFLPAMVPGLAQAQTQAARVAASAIAAGTGQPMSIVPEAFAGHAANGGTLTKELVAPLVELYVSLASGVDTVEAYQSSFDSMDAILTNEIHDAARQAESVQMVDHKVTYYIRFVEPGACSRCILLANRHYKWNAGFERHPRCRCYHIQYESTYRDPVGSYPGSGTLVDNRTIDPFKVAEQATPKQIFAAMTEAQQNDTFGIADARAIRDGADIYQVVNSSTKSTKWWTTITGPQGQQYRGTIQGSTANGGRARLVPEAIYQIAGNDQAYAQRLLRINGYIL